jgi:glycosyltransferase involved in cell wall biosynthesis
MKILIVANTDWYIYNYRLALASRLRGSGWEVVLVSPPGPYVSRLGARGFRWIPLHLSRRGVLPPQELRAVLNLARLYDREKPDLLHHFTLKPVLYGSIAARWRGCQAIVNSVAGLGYLFQSTRPTMQAVRALVSPLFRYALAGEGVRVIFENEDDRSYFIRQGFVAEWKTRVIQGVGVDLERFQPSEEPDGRMRIMMASRMLWDKGVREFIEAARLVSERYPSARFILVGEPDPGNPSSISEEMIRGWVEEGVVEWWGHRQDMPRVYQQAHMIVLPSYGEGVPTVLMEAAASGRAVIASDIPGCQAVVREGETGILVPVRDFETLAHAIEVLIENPLLRREMGQKGRLLMEGQFDQEIMNSRTMKVYEQLLSGDDTRTYTRRRG